MEQVDRDVQLHFSDWQTLAKKVERTLPRTSSTQFYPNLNRALKVKARRFGQGESQASWTALVNEWAQHVRSGNNSALLLAFRRLRLRRYEAAKPSVARVEVAMDALSVPPVLEVNQEYQENATRLKLWLTWPISNDQMHALKECGLDTWIKSRWAFARALNCQDGTKLIGTDVILNMEGTSIRLEISPGYQGQLLIQLVDTSGIIAEQEVEVRRPNA